MRPKTRAAIMDCIAMRAGSSMNNNNNYNNKRRRKEYVVFETMSSMVDHMGFKYNFQKRYKNIYKNYQVFSKLTRNMCNKSYKHKTNMKNGQFLNHYFLLCINEFAIFLS
eukprot:PhM_4_TR2743/c0_g1_i1/m.86246